MEVGYPNEKACEAYATLSEMGELSFLKLVPTAMLRDSAEDAMVKRFL
ncbi:MAG: hypothetical protein QXE79_07565 [Candidatus Bathyarchaeia archaeon]